MYRKYIKAISLILFLLTVNSFGQITENPSVGSSNWNNTKITKVEITEHETNVTVEYTKTEKSEKQDSVSFSSETYLRPKGGFVSYHVQRLADGKELGKRYPTLGAVGTKYVFVLIFPKLESGIEYIDIIEPNGFRWENVTIKNPKPAAPAVEADKKEIQTKMDIRQEQVPTDSKAESIKPDKEIIAKLEAEYLKALIDADVKALERLLSSTYSAKGDTKEKFLVDVKTSETKYLSYETSGVGIDIQDNLAKVKGNLKSERRRSDGERLLIEGTFARSWKFDGMKWELVSTELDVIDRYAKRTPVSEMEKLAKTLKPKKSLEFEYNKFDDFSVIQTESYNLVSGLESFVANTAVGIAQQNGNYGDTKNIVTDLYFRAVVGFNGTTMVGKPYAYGLQFEVDATSWQLLGGDKTLYFIIDEERLKLEPNANPKTDVNSNSTSGVRTSETIFYLILAKDLSRIVNAKSVELRLGNTKPRKMKQELQNRIRNLLIVTGNESVPPAKP